MKEIAFELTARAPTRLADRRAALKGEIADTVMSLLAKSPDDRPASAGKVAEIFERLAKAAPGSQASQIKRSKDQIPQDETLPLISMEQENKPQ
jgi:hypothetical protein